MAQAGDGESDVLRAGPGWPLRPAVSQCCPRGQAGGGPSGLQSQVRPHPPGTGSGTSRHAFFPGCCQSGPCG